MTDKTLQIGIIGSGNIARAHVEGLSKMEDVRIAAVCDVAADRAREMAIKQEAKSYTEAGAMFGDNELDAVWICLPPFAHGEAERQAITHKVPFFVEKPVGLDAGVCREIASAVEQSGILTSVGYMNRYRQTVQVGKEILSEDPPVLAYGAWIGRAPGIGSWWIEKEKSGGQLIEQTTHTVDLARYLMGDAEEVSAYATREFNRHLDGYTIDDASTVAIRFRNGAVANIMSACACSVGGGVFLTVHARNTCLRYTGWEHSVTIDRVEQERSEQIQGEPDIFALEDTQFLKAIRTGDRSSILCDYPDGWKTAELTLAANESMETGKTVKLG